MEYATPGYDGRGHTKSQEGECAFEQDCAHDAEGGIDQDRCNGIGDDVTEDHAWCRVPESCCGADVIEVAHAQHLAAHEAGNRCPPRKTDKPHDQPERSGFYQSHDGDDEEETGEGDDDLYQAGNGNIYCTAEVSGNCSEDYAKRECDGHGDKANAERVARAMNNAGKHITSDTVGAKPVFARWSAVFERDKRLVGAARSKRNWWPYSPVIRQSMPVCCGEILTPLRETECNPVFTQHG